MTQASALSQPLAGQVPADSLVVAVVAADAFASNRIATALETSGLGRVHTADSVDVLISEGPDRPAAVVLACDPCQSASLTAVRRIHAVLPESRIVVVAPARGGGGVRQVLGAGAVGVVLETDLERTLAATTRSVLVGNISVPRSLQRCVYRPAFSYRERQVLAMVVKGLGNRQIAGALYLAESTVKSHLASAFQKLGVSSRKEAAALLTDPDEGLGAAVLGVDGGYPALSVDGGAPAR